MLIVDSSPRENIIRVEKSLQLLPAVKEVANVIRVMDR